jgi:Glutaredoxin-like domain protein
MSHLFKEKDKAYIREKFNKELKGEVRIINFTQEFECEQCWLTREILEILTTLSDKIKLNVFDFTKDFEQAKIWNINKIPATLIFGMKEYKVRYFGTPLGYEFAALLEDIIDVSKGETRLSNVTKEKLKSINKPVHIQVFVTPTCPYCPRAVRIAHQMAIENPNITADMIEIEEFPHLANKYQVMAVPKVVINESITFEGALPEPYFLEYVMYAANNEKFISND